MGRLVYSATRYGAAKVAQVLAEGAGGREHQPLPKIGPWVEHVDQFLRANEG